MGDAVALDLMHESKDVWSSPIVWPISWQASFVGWRRAFWAEPDPRSDAEHDHASEHTTTEPLPALPRSEPSLRTVAWTDKSGSGFGPPQLVKFVEPTGLRSPWRNHCHAVDCGSLRQTGVIGHHGLQIVA